MNKPIPMTALPAAHLSQDKLLPPQEAAQELDVTAGTLAVWRSSGRYNLPFVKIGSKVRYRPSDIQAFIESRTRTQTFI